MVKIRTSNKEQKILHPKNIFVGMSLEPQYWNGLEHGIAQSVSILGISQNIQLHHIDDVKNDVYPSRKKIQPPKKIWCQTVTFGGQDSRNLL